MQYTHRYTLDKAYFEESFEQSLPFSQRSHPKWGLILLLIALGLFSIIQLKSHYVGYFLLALAILEVVAFKFNKPWWVARQRVSRAAGHDVEFTIDDTGIHTQVNSKEQHLTWECISRIIETEKGVIFELSKHHKLYLSNSALNTQVREFIHTQAKQKPQ